MAVVSLTDIGHRTQFFHKAVLRNLNYWQERLKEIPETKIVALDSERDNIVRAILYAFELGTTAWPLTYPLITTLSPYMERRGFWNVWNRVLRRAIELTESAREEAQSVHLSALLARLLFQQSHYQEAIHCYRQTIRQARRIGDKFNEARACSNLGYCYTELGQWCRAEVLCCHALDTFEQIGSSHGMAHTENHLGCLYTRQEQWPEAEQHLQRACAIWREMDDQHGLMRGYTNLSLLYIDTHQPEEALVSLIKARDYALITGDELTLGTIYMNMGFAHRLKKNYLETETYLRQAETIFKRHYHTFGLAQIQDNLGLLCLDQQQWSQAELHLEAALTAWHTLDSKYHEIQAILYLAEYYLAQGILAPANVRLGEAEQLLNHHDPAHRFRSYWARLDKLRRSLKGDLQTTAK